MGTNERKRRMFIKQAVIIVLGLAVLAYAGWHFLKVTAEAELLKVQFQTASGSRTAEFKLEIASSLAERKKGLMYRKTLAPLGGMIFVFPREENHSLWMKNTFVSLDMVFLDSGMKVVGVLENVPVLNEEQRKIPSPSLYVIELPAGTAKAHGITSGATLIISKGKLPRGV